MTFLWLTAKAVTVEFSPRLASQAAKALVTANAKISGNSSVGRAQPCQGWGREFESRFPLQIGGMAEWLCSGLQIRVSRFDSGFRLHTLNATR